MNELFSRYTNLAVCETQIHAALTLMRETYQNGGTMLLCGNGGSCADCDHIVGELMKGFMSLRPITDDECESIRALFPDDAAYFKEMLQRGIPAVSLPSLTAVGSAFVNDVCADMVYAQLMFALGRESDLAIGLSTSGNSKNVVNAMKIAKAKNMKTLALTGANPCKLDEICDVVIKVPETQTYKIQELHLPVYHYLCAALEKELFSEK